MRTSHWDQNFETAELKIHAISRSLSTDRHCQMETGCKCVELRNHSITVVLTAQLHFLVTEK